jgi:hypothetical protein
VAVDGIEAGQFTQGLGLASARTKINRGGKLSREGCDAMNMISVFVGNENRTDLLRLNTQAAQSLDTFFQRKAEIDQQTGIAIVNECAVTLAAAAQ